MVDNRTSTLMWIIIALLMLLICLLFLLGITLIRDNSTALSSDNYDADTDDFVYTPAPTPTNTIAPTPTATPEPIEPFVIAWMSDTQGYTAFKPEIFDVMTNWLAENIEEENIEYVLHTGDIVDDCDDSYEWENAKRAMYVLDGKVPVFTVAGNHDINSGKHEYENYLKYFGEDKYSYISTVGGWYKDGRGRYDLIDINGEPVILMSIGYSVVEADIDWVNNVLQEYSDRKAILCVHGYMDPDESFTSDGRILSPEVVAANENIKIVLCGHRHGVHHNTASFDDDGDGVKERTVYQILFNGQTTKNFGGGYMCFLSFDSEADEVRVHSYSPYYDEYGAMEEFAIPWE